MSLLDGEDLQFSSGTQKFLLSMIDLCRPLFEEPLNAARGILIRQISMYRVLVLTDCNLIMGGRHPIVLNCASGVRGCDSGLHFVLGDRIESYCSFGGLGKEKL